MKQFRNILFSTLLISAIGLSFGLKQSAKTNGGISKNFEFQQGTDTVGSHPEIVMNIPGYPLVFELNKGESILIDRTFKNKRTTRILVLKDFRLFAEPNNWFPDSLGRCNYYKAEVDVLVSGKPFTLMLRPYQMPVTIEGLRIYVEAVRKMDEIRNLDPVDKMEKEVRLSVCLENEPWGNPAELEFPVNDYRWRSASYNNTWSALVPFNALYYHHGEDFGAIPDKLDVCSWADGKVIRTPLPKGNIGSNSIEIENKNGISFYYAHCNIESIDTTILADRFVKKGQLIAKTGMTWNGQKSQHNDPHLHTDMNFNGYQISAFPYLIEAYFRKYDDKVLAVAGGYRFANVGDSVELDATRSVCREKEKIVSFQWRLHNGETIDKPVVVLKYDKPGYYSEELLVKTVSGAVDKDFLQVRVNDSQSSKEISFGWAYYYPVRNIKPGQNILFWNRLNNTKADVSIDFGDGTEIQTMKSEISYSYAKSGNYTVELSSKGINNEPVSVKLEVIVN